MRFVLKAIFFLAVVAAFIPRQPGAAPAAPFYAPAAAGSAEPTAPDPPPEGQQARAVIDVQAQADSQAAAFCERKPALCQTARESAAAARLVSGIALHQARQALADTAEPTPVAETETAPTP